MFGHHYTPIAGTGPIAGPAIAILWGWLPALLWVLFGSIFIGAVHDLGALVVSMRNHGQTGGDADHDGVSDLQELADGTDPTSAASVLRLTFVAAEGGVTLRHPLAANRDYRLEASTDLAEWTAVEGGVELVAAGPVMWCLADAQPAPASFYRVTAVRRQPG